MKKLFIILIFFVAFKSNAQLVTNKGVITNPVPAIWGGTGTTTVATGDLLYGSGTNTWSKLAAGTNGYVLGLTAGIPSWTQTVAYSIAGSRIYDWFLWDSTNTQVINYRPLYTGSTTTMKMLVLDTITRLPYYATIPSISSTGWLLAGNAVTAGVDFLGSTNNTSLNFRTNNVRVANIDSLGGFNMYPLTTTSNFITLYRSGSTVNYPLRLAYEGVTTAGVVFTTTNNDLMFNIDYNGGGTKRETFRMVTASAVGNTRAASATNISTGKFMQKVTAPTSTEISFGWVVANTTPLERFGGGIDANGNAVWGMNNVGTRFYQYNDAASGSVPGAGSFMEIFASGNVMIKNKGTYTQDTTSRFTVVSGGEALAQGSIPAPVMTTTKRLSIITGAAGGSVTNAGSGYTNGTYSSVALTGGTGTGALASIVVAGTIVSSVNTNPSANGAPGQNYTIGDVLTGSFGGGSGFQWTVGTLRPAAMGLHKYDSTLKKEFTWDGSYDTEGAKILSGSASLDFANLVAIGCEDLTITVTGASEGDVVSLGVPNASIIANSSYSVWVSAANTVSVRFCALVSGDPASGTFKVKVFKD